MVKRRQTLPSASPFDFLGDAVQGGPISPQIHRAEGRDWSQDSLLSAPPRGAGKAIAAFEWRKPEKIIRNILVPQMFYFEEQQ